MAPDGKAVLYSGRKLLTNVIDYQLWAAPAGGGPRAEVVSSAGGLTIHDVAADGRLLSTRSESRLTMVVRGPGDTTEREVGWLSNAISGSMSSDGRSLLFTDQSQGQDYGVAQRLIDGSPSVHLGDGAAQDLSRDRRWATALLPSSGRVVLYPTGSARAPDSRLGDRARRPRPLLSGQPEHPRVRVWTRQAALLSARPLGRAAPPCHPRGHVRRPGRLRRSHGPRPEPRTKGGWSSPMPGTPADRCRDSIDAIPSSASVRTARPCSCTAARSPSAGRRRRPLVRPPHAAAGVRTGQSRRTDRDSHDQPCRRSPGVHLHVLALRLHALRRHTLIGRNARFSSANRAFTDSCTNLQRCCRRPCQRI